MIERELSGDIAILRLAHGKANALDIELCSAITETLRREQETSSRAVILTAHGSIFSAGVDLFRLIDSGRDYVERFFPALTEALLALFQFPKPVVAALNGHAIAGGCLIAACADYRLMSGGRIGVPELQVGVPFPAIAIEILRFAAGHNAQWLAYTGRTVPSTEAHAAGLIDEEVSAEQLMTRAHVIAGELMAISLANFATTKRQLRQAAVDRVERLGAMDARSLEVWCSPETHAGIREYLGRTVRQK